MSEAETALDKKKKQREIDKLDLEILSLTVELESSRLGLKRFQDRDNNERSEAEHHRVYHFYGGVNHVSVALAMNTIGQWARKEVAPIEMVFNSPGGSIIEGLALYDFILSLRDKGHEVTTVGLGMVASMGGVLLQAGDHRIVGRNCHMLIHEASTYANGKISDMEDEVAFVKRLQDRLVDILSERSTLTKAEIKRRWKRRDWWIDAEQTVALGFADEIR